MPQEIGWSVESKLIYQIKQVLSKGLSSIYNAYWQMPTNDYSFPNTPGSYISPLDMRAVSNGTLLSTSVYYPTLYKSYPDVTRTYKAYSFNNTTTTVFLDGVPASSGTIGYTFNGIEAINQTTGISFNIPFYLNKIEFPDLLFMNLGISTGNNILITGSPGALTMLLFPKLIYMRGGIILPTGTVTFSLPKAEVIDGLLQVGINVTSLSLPELLFVRQFTDTVSNISSYSFPKLKVIHTGGFSISGTKTALTSITFGDLEYCATTFTMPTSSPALTTFSFAPTLKLFNSNFVTTSNALNQASVDNILIRLAALDGTGGTIAYSSKTVTITGGAATPSAAGLAAKAILVARGCTVTNN
jgi:hypothetical protein